jgi:anthranilate phosphoribosyltransferase
MLNPAKVQSQVMGVFSAEFTELIAEVLGNLGVKHALVVHGSDGLDEFTLTGPTKVTELKDGWLRNWTFDPEEYGFEYCAPDDLKGGTAEENAIYLLRILGGEKGPRRDIVVINAAAAILAADLADNFKDAIAKAKASIDSGAASKILDKLGVFSKTF